MALESVVTFEYYSKAQRMRVKIGLDYIRVKQNQKQNPLNFCMWNKKVIRVKKLTTIGGSVYLLHSLWYFNI